jgi:hypothetical protein
MDSSESVAENCATGVKLEKKKGLKKWAPCFYSRNRLEPLAIQWEKFGNEFANQ